MIGHGLGDLYSSCLLTIESMMLVCVAAKVPRRALFRTLMAWHGLGLQISDVIEMRVT